MLINLSEIMSVPGKVEHVKVPIERKSFKISSVEYPFASKEPVTIIVTNLGEKRVLIEGKGRLSLVIPCSRCLEEVITDFEFSMSKEVDFKITDDQRLKELDETNFISGYNLDVDILVYDEILVDFPMKVLCDENCKGICNVCGVNLNKGTCCCESTTLDPRMSVIRDIFKNNKEV